MRREEVVDFLQSQNELFVELSISKLNDEVIVNSIRGSEAISELFEFQVNFSSVNREINAEDILGSDAVLYLKSENHERFVHGIVTQFSQGTTSLKEDIHHTEYFFTMRPKLWLLSLDSNCKIFQKKSTMEIVKEVIDEHKIEASTSKSKNDSREYCVQYNESSFDFISRLMENEGIFYYFKHEKGKHILVIRDTIDSNQKLKTKAEFIKTNHEILPIGKVFNTSKNTFINVSGYSAADYNYQNSKAKLFSKLEINKKWKGKTSFYEYPGGFFNSSDGKNVSELRLQEIECNHVVLQGDSTIPEFCPGTTFELSSHHAENFNQAYVLYKVEHMFDRSGKNGFIYRNRFLALPKGIKFRPPRKTPKPKIYGNQTAVVVCPSGKEIYRDKYCSVKVHFHWDQYGKSKDTDDSSCWIRVAQSLSGSNWGATYVPRVGQEVVVSFLEGDPDRPLIVGCVYNDQFMPPYSDSQEKISTIKTQTFTNTSKFNEIRFNDEKEKEEIFVHAQKDVKVDVIDGSHSTKLHAEPGKKVTHSLEIVKGDKLVLLKEGDSKYTMKKGNSTIELDDGNSSITLKKGNSEITLKKGDSSIKLQKGNQTIDINGNCTIKISGNLKIKADKNISIEAGKEFSIKSGAEMKANAGKSLTVKAATTAKFQSGTDFTCKSGTSMKIQANMNIDVKAKMMLNEDGKIMTKISGATVQINGKALTKISAPVITAGGGIVKLG